MDISIEEARAAERAAEEARRLQESQLTNAFSIIDAYDTGTTTDLLGNYSNEWFRNNIGDTGNLGRMPTILTTEVMAHQGRYLMFWAGPESAQWHFRQRGATQETRGGMIQHYYKDSRRNTYFDEPEIQFTFQSGNILPVRMTKGKPGQKMSKAESTVVAIPFGLLNLYEFIELLDQKKAIADGRTNYVYILYSSNVFPRIILRGFFTPDGLSFSESGNENAEVKWSATFKVVGSYPKFNSAYSLAETWRAIQQRRGYQTGATRSAFTGAATDQTPSGS
jgi:hypothetical protein